MNKPTEADLERARAFATDFLDPWPDESDIAQLIADVRAEDRARIEALEAKCALLEASLKKVAAECDTSYVRGYHHGRLYGY